MSHIRPPLPDDPYDPVVGQIPRVLGFPVAIPGNVIRTEGLAISMDQFIVFREGFIATIRAIGRPGHLAEVDLFRALSGRPDIHPSEQILWNLKFSDGRRGQTGVVEPEEAGSFLIIPKGGGGTRNAQRSQSWVYAIPSPGPMTFIVSWEAGGLAETSVQIDASAIVAAAQQVEPSWLD